MGEGSGFCILPLPLKTGRVREREQNPVSILFPYDTNRNGLGLVTSTNQLAFIVSDNCFRNLALFGVPCLGAYNDHFVPFSLALLLL